MKTTIMRVSVHGNTEDPTFGDDVLDIQLKDEGGGLFLSFTKDEHEIGIDFKEWEQVIKAVNMLITQPSVK